MKNAADDNEWLTAVNEAEEYLLLCGCDYRMLADPSLREQILASAIKFYIEDRLQDALQR